MKIEIATYGVEFRKAAILLSLLVALICPVKAQFVDIAINLQSGIELKLLGPQQTSQKPDGTRTGNLSARENATPGLSWIRIRAIENMVLMVEIRYPDQMETKDDRHAAYLNDGSDNITEARFILGNRANFPLNSNTSLMERMNSPQPWQDAWIGLPIGNVREVLIEYN